MCNNSWRDITQTLKACVSEEVETFKRQICKDKERMGRSGAADGNVGTQNTTIQ